MLPCIPAEICGVAAVHRHERGRSCFIKAFIDPCLQKSKPAKQIAELLKTFLYSLRNGFLAWTEPLLGSSATVPGCLHHLQGHR